MKKHESKAEERKEEKAKKHEGKLHLFGKKHHSGKK